MKFYLAILLAFMSFNLSGCAFFDRYTTLGEAPALSAIKNPVAQPGYRPVSFPTPEPKSQSFNKNSLWSNGTKGFFRNQRTSDVGDILTVLIEINDKAEIDNTTERTRDNSENLGLDSIAGYENKLKKLLPKATRDSVDFGNLIDLDSQAKSNGAGTVDREEKLKAQVSAVVTQKLPNGNLVIEGRQEIRVNYEIRELVVTGVVRASDISLDNSVPFSKLAEARLSYGGRGQLSDVQQARFGQQVLDVLLPF